MGKKEKKVEGYPVTLGDQAYSFFDASTGIQITKGEVKVLNSRQFNCSKIKKALNTGHLKIASTEENDLYNQSEVDSLVERFEEMVKSGMEASKIAQAFTDDEVDKIAGEYGLTRDNGEDSAAVLQSVIKSEFENKKE